VIRKLVLGVVVVAAAAAAASQAFGGPARYVIVSGRSMEPALHTGDVVFLLKRGDYGRGDVVAFRVPEGEAGAGGIVIHRIVSGSANTDYLLKGDNRDGRDPWRPTRRDVIGGMALRVPGFGAIPALAGPLGLALSGAFVIFLLATASPRRERPA
jgi:signal peptidase I